MNGQEFFYTDLFICYPVHPDILLFFVFSLCFCGGKSSYTTFYLLSKREDLAALPAASKGNLKITFCQ